MCSPAPFSESETAKNPELTEEHLHFVGSRLEEFDIKNGVACQRFRSLRKARFICSFVFNSAIYDFTYYFWEPLCFLYDVYKHAGLYYWCLYKTRSCLQCVIELLVRCYDGLWSDGWAPMESMRNGTLPWRYAGYVRSLLLQGHGVFS